MILMELLAMYGMLIKIPLGVFMFAKRLLTPKDILLKNPTTADGNI